MTIEEEEADQASPLNEGDSSAKDVPFSPPSDGYFTKRCQIRDYLKTKDKFALRCAAFTEGGFIEDSLRIRVWPLLTNAEMTTFEPLSQEELERNRFYQQVVMDVDRSLKRFPPSVHEAKRLEYQDSLTKMILRILCHNTDLHYYQGYHDICLTFLLIMDEESCFKLVYQVSNSHLKYFMEKTMNTTSNHLQIIYLLLSYEDGDLHDYLIRSEVGTIFSLSWVITWFSHVLADFTDITRLFDYFLSSHFLMPVYLTTAILLHKKEEILSIDCDMASMHKYLTNIPQNERLPFDKLIQDSLRLAVNYPPNDTLEKEHAMQQFVMKDAGQSPKSPYKYFSFIRKNVFSITFAVLVGALIYQLYSEYSRGHDEAIN